MLDNLIMCLPVIGWGVILLGLVMAWNLLACLYDYIKDKLIERRNQDVVGDNGTSGKGKRRSKAA